MVKYLNSLRGKQWLQATTAVVAPPSGGGGGGTPTTIPGISSSAPGPMTDFIFRQPQPIDPVSEDYTIAGWCEPVGGIGPFRFITPDAGNFACFVTYGFQGVVRVFGGIPANKTFRLTCIDARGVSITKSCAVAVAASSPTLSCNDINPVYNTTLDTFYGGPQFRPSAPGLQSVYTGVTLQDGSPSTQWVSNYGPKWYQGGAAVIPPGSYPVKFTGTSNGTPVADNFTIVIVATPTTGFIELSVGAMSTSTLARTPLGKAKASTPTNTPTWSVDDGGNNYLAINPVTGVLEVKNAPASPGTFPFNLTVTDQNYSHTQAFSLVVAAGQTLAPSNITLSLDRPFTNYFYRAQYIQRPVSTAAPVLSGFPNLANVQWAVTNQQRFNWQMDNPFEPSLVDYDGDTRGGPGGGYKRIGCDATTGLPYVQAVLSDTTGTPGEWFDLTATDGVRTCTRRFYINVTPVIGPKIYVGPNSAPSGFTKVASMMAALAPFLGYESNLGDISAIAGTEIKVEYDPANPNRYVKDWDQNYGYARADYCGPFSITGIPGPGGQLPYYGGGKRSSDVNRGDKALLHIGNGDFAISNMQLGDIHMGVFGGNFIPASNRTMSLVRRESGGSGDTRITNCDIGNADVPLECGNSDGQWIIKNTRIFNGSGCSSRSGANQHNAYIGMCWNLIGDNVLSIGAANGHVFKLRSANSTWTNSRFYDGECGTGFNQIDLPCGGTHSFSYCHFEKGAAPQNPYMVQFAEEIPGALPFTLPTQDYVHALSFDHCTFTKHCTDTLAYGGDKGGAMIAFYGRLAPHTGVASTLSLTNSIIEGYPANKLVVTTSNFDPTHDFGQNITVSGNTFPATFTPLNLTSPCSYDNGRPGLHNSLGDLNHGYYFDNNNAVQMDPGVDEIRIPANSPPGTVICANMRAYGVDNYSLSGNAQPDPLINPFLAGTTWGFGMRTTARTGVAIGYNNGHFSIVTNGDGVSGSLLVGPNGLGGAGCDVILARAVSPASTGSIPIDNPLFIVKT
jgi:hypothetical protein